MRRADRVWHTALILAGLSGCSPPALQHAAAPATPTEAGPICRVGPDGRPLFAERGIGGTGSPAGAVQQAERGIGGTGGPATLEAERGIGGTGIVGVVTGFASICLAGEEVAIDETVPIRAEGRPAGIDSLRAGQVAAINAQGSAGGLRAREIALRFEVSGPVESAGAEGELRVAGQRVRVSGATWGERNPRVGDWVAVSGLRGEDGVIQATRIDKQPPGPVVVHGVLQERPGGLAVGDLPIQGLPLAYGPGRNLTVSGPYLAGALQADSVAPDVLAEDPVAYFGPTTQWFVLEAFVVGGNGGFRLGQRGPRFVGPGAGRAVLTFRRGPDGSVVSPSLRTIDGPRSDRSSGDSAPGRPGAAREVAPVPSRSFEPAPVPNRSMDASAGYQGRSGGSLGRASPSGSIRGDGAAGHMGPSNGGSGGPGGGGFGPPAGSGMGPHH